MKKGKITAITAFFCIGDQTQQGPGHRDRYGDAGRIARQKGIPMKYGLITISIIAALICAALAFVLVLPAQAATKNNARFGFPVTRDMGVTAIDNLYVIFVDTATGYMAHKTTGVAAINTSWANAAVTGASQATTDTALGGTNTQFWVCDPPPLDLSKEWCMMVFENGTPANTDVPIIVVLYDPVTNKTYTDAVPAAKGGVLLFNK